MAYKMRKLNRVNRRRAKRTLKLRKAKLKVKKRRRSNKDLI